MNSFVQLFMPYLNFEYTKVDSSWVKSSFSFSSVEHGQPQHHHGDCSQQLFVHMFMRHMATIQR